MAKPDRAPADSGSAAPMLDSLLASVNADDLAARIDEVRRSEWFLRTPAEGARLLAARLGSGTIEAPPPALWLLATELHLRAGQFTEGRRALSSGFDAFGDRGDPDELSRAYLLHGLIDASDNRWDGAVSAWEESLKLLPPDSGLELGIRKLLGQGWEAMGVSDRAMINYQESLKIAARSSNAEAECELLCLLGQHAHARGDIDDAAGYFTQALRRARECGLKLGEATAQLGYGDVCLAIGENDDAGIALENGLALARELGDPFLQIVALERVAEVRWRSQRLDEARAALEEAVFLCKGCGAPAAVASVYHMMAMLHEASGKTSLALSAYEKAVEERRKADDPGGLGATLNNLGSLYHRLGDPDSARRFYREALLAFSECGGDRSEIQITLENLQRLDRTSAAASPARPRTATDLIDPHQSRATASRSRSSARSGPTG